MRFSHYFGRGGAFNNVRVENLVGKVESWVIINWETAILSCSSYRTTCKIKSHPVGEGQQTVASSGDSKDENKMGYISCGAVCIARSICYIPKWSTSRRASSAQSQHTWSWCTVDCCSVSESRTYCYFTLVQPVALILKRNHWISHYKLPQPVHLIHLNMPYWGLGLY